ncbi:MAG: type II toxin-antitoxin system PemK/MazF family toxin [Gemmatimonadota bacterium]|nr:MAG: type II toxin-antitoxin system PemK/MazF family toxin [Gemmatimonadota bacterium]
MGYVPGRGHAIWLSFDPQPGHEQGGRRRALVVSPASYNEKVGLALVCPITSRVKGYPFEVETPKGSGVEGVVLSDQVKSLDWEKRKVEFICQVPGRVIRDVVSKLHILLEAE